MAENSHGVRHFRDQLAANVKSLRDLCNKWKQIAVNEQPIPEDVLGNIRSAVGLAELLMNQRFKQFESLIVNCEMGLGEKETRCEDLEGFWDMVYFQIEDVYKKFKLLDDLKENHWTVPQVKTQMESSKAKAKPSSVHLAEAKRDPVKLKLQKQAARQRILSAKENKPAEIKVFEMPSFFTVSSPVKTPKPVACTPPPSNSSKRASEKKSKSTSAKKYASLPSVTRSAKRSQLNFDEANGDFEEI